MFSEAIGVWMAWISPVAQQAFPKFRHTPDHSPVFELGIFLKIDSVNEHGKINTPDSVKQTDLSGPFRMSAVADFVTLELWREQIGRSRNSKT